MSNTATPRRFWRIHLSTAIVLMLGAAVLLWANLTPSDDCTNEEDEDFLYVSYQKMPYMIIETAEKDYYHEYGWPVIAHRVHHMPQSRHHFAITYEQAALIDAAVALGMLTTIAVLCEAFVRRSRRQVSEIQ